MSSEMFYCVDDNNNNNIDNNTTKGGRLAFDNWEQIQPSLFVVFVCLFVCFICFLLFSLCITVAGECPRYFFFFFFFFFLFYFFFFWFLHISRLEMRALRFFPKFIKFHALSNPRNTLSSSDSSSRWYLKARENLWVRFLRFFFACARIYKI